MDRFIAAESYWISEEFRLFLETNTFGAQNWKWIAAVLVFLVGYILFLIFRRIFKKIRQSWSFLRRGKFLNFFLDLPIERSTAMIAATSISISLFESLAIPNSLGKYLSGILHLLLAYNLIRLAYWGVEAMGRMFSEFASKTESSIDDQLAPIATKSLKVLVVVVGTLIMMQNFGVNVTALLAGLGIGGVAIAFAAQDTVANLFGTITILSDAPFKLGDLVRVGDTEGTVEEVGFRSTRIRTAYNSLVVFPNSVIAKEKIDNLTERQQVRFRHNFGLHYDTTSEKISEFCERVKYILIQNPEIDRDKILVVFNGYLDSSLNILVNAFMNVKPGTEDLRIQDRLLHEILKMSKEIGVDFAYPTRTIFLQGLSLQGAPTETPSSLAAASPRHNT